MRSLVLLVFLLLFSSVPRIAAACGFQPYSDQAEDDGAALEVLLRADRLPILSPGWHSEYWVIAWARLHGKRFVNEEVASLSQDRHWLRLSPGPAVSAAIAQWMATRQAQGAPSVQPPDPHRRAANYSYQLICGPDAFVTASETLRDRSTASIPAYDVSEWIVAQDQVFARCADSAAPLPEPLPATAARLARHDRDYQRAAAMDYGGETVSAINAFDAIARSPSPWADIARYRVALLRVRSGSADATDLRERLSRTTDTKARRGLVQLLDRVELFVRPPADVVQVLSSRLLQESLGADLPRVLRDIVHFAKRIPSGNCAGDLVAVVTGRAVCRGSTSVLADLRQAHLTGRVPRLTGRLLEINRRFHAARTYLEAGRTTLARREARALLHLTQHSSAPTQNAAHAVALVTAPNPEQVLSHIFRRSTGGPVLHRDGQQAMAQLSMRWWRRLLRVHSSGTLPTTTARRVAGEGLIRAIILGNDANMRTFARMIQDHVDTDISLRTAVQAALDGPPSDLRFALLFAIVSREPFDLSITDEFEDHWSTTQGSGCGFGYCGDAHPGQTPVGHLVPASSMAVRTSWERRRVAAAGRRLNALGDLVLALAEANEGDPRTPEMLHRYIRLTRRASVHRRTDSRTGVTSRRAFDLLHERHGDSPWAEQTRYWYR